MKYTCIKSGKKFVWNKGVKVVPVAKPTSTPNPIPQVIPTPSPTPTLTQTPTTSPTPSPIAPVVTIQGTALSEMKKSISPISGPEFFKFHYSPRADKTFIEFL